MAFFAAFEGAAAFAVLNSRRYILILKMINKFNRIARTLRYNDELLGIAHKIYELKNMAFPINQESIQTYSSLLQTTIKTANELVKDFDEYADVVEKYSQQEKGLHTIKNQKKEWDAFIERVRTPEEQLEQNIKTINEIKQKFLQDLDLQPAPSNPQLAEMTQQSKAVLDKLQSINQELEEIQKEIEQLKKEVNEQHQQAYKCFAQYMGSI